MDKGKVDLLIWNKAKNGSVSFSKIDILQIEDRRHNERELGEFVVKAYLTNGTDAFMGDWATEQEAREFVDNIHKEVEQIATGGFAEDKLREVLKEILVETPNYLDRDPMLDM